MSNGETPEVPVEEPIVPLDIPWERLCVSEDMIDRKVCDRDFPYRWRSSLAVFGYEPPEEEQVRDDVIVTYVKVVSTITGFQPDPEEVGISDRRIDSYWNDPEAIADFKDAVSEYYGCYGAVLEVAVAPKVPRDERPTVPLSRYPYIADFEPKKRELYEVVTETGQVMSRSLDQANVKKGMTTSESHEVLDVFKGFTASGGYDKVKASLGVSGEWGTKDMTKQEYSDVRTTDRLAEMSQTYGHSTTINQLYHQLNSYHLGTNRSVFMMLPRPHIVEAETGFVNGPRLLEGVQEFFFVVARPRSEKEFCIEAYMETAHIASEPIKAYEQSTGSLTLHVQAPCRDTSGSFGDDSNTTTAEKSETYTPPAGWEVDLDRDGGYRIESASGTRIEEATVTEADRDHVTIYGRVTTRFEDRTWPQSNVCHYGVLDMVVTIYIRKKEPNVTGYTQTLWLTGRGLCCCPPDVAVLAPGEFLTAERPIADWLTKHVGTDQLTVHEANRLREDIARDIPRALNDPLRYPFGKLRFPEAGFIGRRMSETIRETAHPDNVIVTELPGLSKEIAEKVYKVAPKASRGRMLAMPMAEQVDRFGLTEDEAAELRRALVGTAAEPKPPSERWDRPEKKEVPRKPTRPGRPIRPIQRQDSPGQED